MRARRTGFSLTEVLVVLVILTIVAGGVYRLVTDARLKTARVEARSAAAEDAARILAQMTQDLSQAALGTLRLQGSGDQRTLTLDLPPPARQARPVAVTWRYQKPVLTRSTAGRDHEVSRHLEGWEIGKVVLPGGAIATGQYLLEVRVTWPVAGQNEPETHEQKQIITARVEAAEASDPFWVKAGDTSGVVDGYRTALRNLLGSVVQTSEAIGSRVWGNVTDAVAAINQSIASIRTIKDMLRELNVNLDLMLQGETFELLTDRNHPLGLLSATNFLTELKNCVPADLRNMTFESFCRRYNIVSGVLSNSARDLFEKKLELVKAGQMSMADLEQAIQNTRRQFPNDALPTIPTEFGTIFVIGSMNP